MQNRMQLPKGAYRQGQSQWRWFLLREDHVLLIFCVLKSGQAEVFFNIRAMLFDTLNWRQVITIHIGMNIVISHPRLESWRLNVLKNREIGIVILIFNRLGGLWLQITANSDKRGKKNSLTTLLLTSENTSYLWLIKKIMARQVVDDRCTTNQDINRLNQDFLLRI